MPVTRFRDVFATFLRVRRMGRHFRRRLLPESLPAAGAGRALPAPLGQALAASAASAPEALLARLGSRAAGLTEDEARSLRARVGLNEVGHEKPLPW